jgi:hypothetical protein
MLFGIAFLQRNWQVDWQAAFQDLENDIDEAVLSVSRLVLLLFIHCQTLSPSLCLWCRVWQHHVRTAIFFRNSTTTIVCAQSPER